MKYRKLRIAWSVGWGVLALLLIVLWVRSSTDTCDQFWGHFQANKSFEVNSKQGHVWFGILYDETIPFQLKTFKLNDEQVKYYRDLSKFRFMESILAGSGTCVFAAPHWFLMLFALAIAAVPWLRWRFPLRTLLIATTLIAVALGVAVYSLRN